MGLSKDSVKKAWEILNEINPEANNKKIVEWKKGDPIVFNKILGYDHKVYDKVDYGWENVFMYIQDPSVAQLEIFFSRKKEVHNSALFNAELEDVICIGWF